VELYIPNLDWYEAYSITGDEIARRKYEWWAYHVIKLRQPSTLGREKSDVFPDSCEGRSSAPRGSTLQTKSNTTQKRTFGNGRRKLRVRNAKAYDGVGFAENAFAGVGVARKERHCGWPEVTRGPRKDLCRSRVVLGHRKAVASIGLLQGTVSCQTNVNHTTVRFSRTEKPTSTSFPRTNR
jgi:hypothetical protein